MTVVQNLVFFPDPEADVISSCRRLRKLGPELGSPFDGRAYFFRDTHEFRMFTALVFETLKPPGRSAGAKCWSSPGHEERC